MHRYWLVAPPGLIAFGVLIGVIAIRVERDYIADTIGGGWSPGPVDNFLLYASALVVLSSVVAMTVMLAVDVHRANQRSK